MKKKFLMLLTLALALSLFVVGCSADEKDPVEENDDMIEENLDDKDNIKDDDLEEDKDIDTDDKLDEEIDDEKDEDKDIDDSGINPEDEKEMYISSIKELQGPKRFLEEWNVDEFSKIEIGNVMPVIKLEHGGNSVKAFKLNERGGKPTGFSEKEKIVVEDGVLKLQEDFDEDELFLVIQSRDLRSIDLVVENFGGLLIVEDKVNHMDLLDIYGVVEIQGYEPFDIKANNISGVLNGEFDYLDFNVNIKDVSGLVNIFDERGINEDINKTFGDGNYNIDIENVPGVINLELDD